MVFVFFEKIDRFFCLHARGVLLPSRPLLGQTGAGHPAGGFFIWPSNRRLEAL
jgi:hypothetical protein